MVFNSAIQMASYRMEEAHDFCCRLIWLHPFRQLALADFTCYTERRKKKKIGKEGSVIDYREGGVGAQEDESKMKVVF